MKKVILLSVVVCTVLLVAYPLVVRADDDAGEEDAEIKILQRQLRAGETKDRVDAAKSLGKIKSEAAFGVLVRGLTIKDEKVRKAVITAVASFNSPEAAKALGKIFKRCEAGIQLHIIKYLSRYNNMGEAEVFLEAIKDKKDEQEKVKKEGIRHLNKRRDQEVVIEAFLKIMKKKEEYMLRSEIVGNVPLKPEDEREMEIMTMGLKEKEYHIVAIRALGRLGSMEIESNEKLELALLAGRSKSPLVHDKLIGVVQKIGTDEAIDALLKMLRSEKNSQNSQKICKALGKMGGEKAAKGLSDYVLHNDIEIRLAAVRALGGIQNETSMKALRKSLRSEEAEVQIAAIQGLAKFKSPDVIKDLRRAATSGDASSKVQIEVIKALKEINDPEAVEVLVKFVERADMPVRTEALKALGQMKARAAVEPIEKQIRKFIRKEDRDSRRFLNAAINALGKIGGPEVEDVLVLLTKARIEDVRKSAISELGNFSSDSTVDALIKACSDPNTGIRLAALTSLRKSLPSKAVKAIVRLLQDSDHKIRLTAIETLGEYALPGAAVHLAVKYDDEKEYKAAVKALSTINSKKSREFLLQALAHENGGVRLDALAGLGLPWAVGDGGVAEKLIDYLGQEERRQQRDAAIAALGNTSMDTAMAKLEELSTSKILPDALSAVKAMGRTKSERVTAFLMKIIELDTTRYPIKMEAIYSLGEAGGEQSVATLEKLLDLDDYKMKETVVEALGKIDSEEARKALIKGLGDESKTVVKAAVRVLAKYHDDTEVVQAVLKLTESDSTSMRNMVVKLLPIYVTHDVMPTLLAHFKDDASKEVQANCLCSLRRLMNRDVGENPEDWDRWWLSERDKPLEELANEGFREKGYEISGDTDKKTITEYFRALTDDSDYIRYNAVRRLRKIAGREFGYRPDAKNNRKALEEWDKWWRENENKYK